MGFDVLMVVKMRTGVSWVMILCSLVGLYQRSEEHAASIFRENEDGLSILSESLATIYQTTLSQTRRQKTMNAVCLF
jgi:hypothetical protein